MKPATVEVWVWLLIYGGLLMLSLGLFAQRSDAVLGHSLIVAGGLVAALGALLIVVRARMKSD
jgi:hypothetical protein